MRACTLVASVALHVLVVATLVIAPILAATELPEPHVMAPIFLTTPVTVSMPEVQPRAGRATHSLAPPSRAPIEAPPQIVAESAAEDPRDLSIGGSRSILSFEPVGGAGLAPDLPTPPPRVSTPPVRVGSVIRAPAKVHHVAPVYPVIAREARVEGTVILEAVISISGDVQDVRVLRSVPLLDAAAIDAVVRWRFTPTILNGETIPVVMTVTVTFSLR